MSTTIPPYNWRVPVNTDLVRDGWQAINDLAEDIAKTLPGLAKPTSFEDENVNQVAVSSGTGAVTITSRTFTLPKPMTVDVFGQIHAEPSGNAAGSIWIRVDGDNGAVRNWHSRNTSQHQWPAIWWSGHLAAGTHTIDLRANVSGGSSATSIDHGYLSTVIRGVI